ncbi:MAG TPA: hypothetical protein PKY87_12710 [Terricaulis sp.]|nr:hypothetical protein [Terricaulis sp.]
MRALVLALALAACSQPASAPQNPPAPPSPEAATQSLVDALTPVLAADIGQPVALTPSQTRIMDEWGWLVAHPAQASGAAIDWSQTKYAENAEAGVLDGDGVTYALLRQEAGQWRVVEFIVGPTDVAWADWPARHGAPEALFE